MSIKTFVVPRTAIANFVPAEVQLTLIVERSYLGILYSSFFQDVDKAPRDFLKVKSEKREGFELQLHNLLQ